MKLKALLSALLIVALLCPAALMEEGLNEPLPVSEEAVVTDSTEEVTEPDGETVSSGSIDAVEEDAAPDVEDEGESEQSEQPQDSVPTDSEEEVLVVETVDEVVPEEDFEEDYVCFEAEVADDVDFVSDEAADGVAADGDIVINSTNFPDDNFRAYIAGWFNKNEGDSLSEAERSEVKQISINRADNGEIKNLTGIKLFPNLEELYVVYNSLTTLDVSGCSNLEQITCYENHLTELKASDCPKLTYIDCGDNQLTALEISNCAELSNLDCYGNQLTTLKVSNCAKLRCLNCYNNKLTELNVSSFSSLEDLHCGRNQLRELDVSNCPLLWQLDCGDNQLRELDVSKCLKLIELDCRGNQLTELNVSNHSILLTLCCKDNRITVIDVSNCTILSALWCERNNIATLNVSDCTKLIYLYCDGNRLTSLNTENCQNLTDLHCSDNQLIRLDVSTLTGLYSLYCNDNQLTNLDISNCTKLYGLVCHNNIITSLDIRNCPNLVSVKEEIFFSWQDDSHICVYDNDDDRCLSFDFGVTVLGGNHVPKLVPKNENPDSVAARSTTPVAPAPAPATPTIPAVKKAGKTTVSAAPGSVYQLDLGGTTGKAFKSSKKKVAVVNAQGLVTIKGAGKTKITFKAGKKKRTLTLTVKDPTIPASVTITPVNTAVKVGDALTLTPVIPANTNSAFKWKSSNKKVAKVVNGVVTFRKPGKVTVTCTAMRGKKKAKVTFKVSK